MDKFVLVIVKFIDSFSVSFSNFNNMIIDAVADTGGGAGGCAPPFSFSAPPFVFGRGRKGRKIFDKFLVNTKKFNRYRSNFQYKEHLGAKIIGLRPISTVTVYKVVPSGVDLEGGDPQGILAWGRRYVNNGYDRIESRSGICSEALGYVVMVPPISEDYVDCGLSMWVR